MQDTLKSGCINLRLHDTVRVCVSFASPPTYMKLLSMLTHTFALTADTHDTQHILAYTHMLLYVLREVESVDGVMLREYEMMVNADVLTNTTNLKIR